MRNEPEVDYRRLWIPIVCFLVAGFAVLSESPYRNWVHSVVGVQSHGNSPKDYLAEQIATGVSAGSGLLLILLLAVFTSRDSWYWYLHGGLSGFDAAAETDRLRRRAPLGVLPPN
ncbi:MAG TPA: hypothetical protein VFG04_24950 [Planctomycetaceae bacterium]|jgi:hypothetical protein|nr:hypothetical protein [Planctomycetaceae bacterium]